MNICSGTFQIHASGLQYSHIQRADMLQEKPIRIEALWYGGL